MVSLEFMDEETKEKILERWKNMSESDKAHFINQVALALSVWGSDYKGRAIVLEVLKAMASEGTQTLADFGLFVEKSMAAKEASGIEDKIKRAAVIIEGYRIKNSLSSEPHKELF